MFLFWARLGHQCSSQNFCNFELFITKSYFSRVQTCILMNFLNNMIRIQVYCIHIMILLFIIIFNRLESLLSLTWIAQVSEEEVFHTTWKWQNTTISLSPPSFVHLPTPIIYTWCFFVLFLLCFISIPVVIFCMKWIQVVNIMLDINLGSYHSAWYQSI